MNATAALFYRGIAEKMSGMAAAADEAGVCRAGAARVAADMRDIEKAARRLEAVVERLDEYTIALEGRLKTRRRS